MISIPKKHQNALERNKYFDFRGAILGSILMSGIVYWANKEYGIDAASIAASKQALYTFFAGGMIAKAAENYALNLDNTWRSKLKAGLIPALGTITLTTIIHNLKGTPEPMDSILPTVALAPPGLLFIAHEKREQLETKLKNLKE